MHELLHLFCRVFIRYSRNSDIPIIHPNVDLNKHNERVIIYDDENMLFHLSTVDEVLTMVENGQEFANYDKETGFVSNVRILHKHENNKTGLYYSININPMETYAYCDLIINNMHYYRFKIIRNGSTMYGRINDMSFQVCSSEFNAIQAVGYLAEAEDKTKVYLIQGASIYLLDLKDNVLWRMHNSDSHYKFPKYDSHVGDKCERATNYSVQPRLMNIEKYENEFLWQQGEVKGVENTEENEVAKLAAMYRGIFGI